MNKFLAIILSILCIIPFASCGSDNEGEIQPIGPVADETAPQITVQYEYKIVKIGEEVSLPTVSFDEEVSAVYKLDGENISPDEKFTPDTVGTKTYSIMATDASGNKSYKDILYTITDDDADLNKIYAVDTVAGLEKQLGVSKNGVNQLSVSLVSSDTDNLRDVDGNSVSDLYLDENGNVVSDAFSADKKVKVFSCLNFTGKYGRLVFSNPLYLNWDKKFSQIYFYIYNAGLSSISCYFNNYAFNILPATGWQKIVIAPKNTEKGIITDYSVISSLSESLRSEGMFDLEDCVGATLRLTAQRYERVYMTAIYGLLIA